MAKAARKLTKAQLERRTQKLTKAHLERLRRKAKADPKLIEYMADAGQPGLAAWARRGRVRFVFEYRPPGGGPRRRMQIDDYGAITLEQARGIAEQYRGRVAAGADPQHVRAEEQRLADRVRSDDRCAIFNRAAQLQCGPRRGFRQELRSLPPGRGASVQGLLLRGDRLRGVVGRGRELHVASVRGVSVRRKRW